MDTWGSRMTTDDMKRPRKAIIDDLIAGRENAIIDALLASERMECTRSYLSWGRRFVGMETRDQATLDCRHAKVSSQLWRG
jgi:hypothetical protein